MGIAQRKFNSGKRRSPAVQGWSVGGWHALFFFAGILLTFVGQIAFGALHKGSGSPPESVASSATRKVDSGKPWGDLVITPVVLDRPEELFDGQNAPAPAIRWCFPNHSQPQIVALIKSCRLAEAQEASLLNTDHWQSGTNGWRIWPAMEVVRDLEESARAKIYSVLAQCPDNPQCYPFTCREDRFQEMFNGCTLSPDKVALVRKLCYHKNGLLYFADAQLFELTTSSNETRCLFQTLLRVPTMLVKLRVTPETDINALIEYWGSGGRAKDLRPLLQAVSRVPGGGSLNVASFFPPVPRLRLYTYPHHTNGLPLDCFWTSFNFFEEKPDYRLGDREYADALLHTDYQRVIGEKQFGDVLILVDSGYALHACVYIADDIYYTKNGTDPNQPWVLMTMKDMAAQYISGQPQEWRIYRRKST